MYIKILIDNHYSNSVNDFEIDKFLGKKFRTYPATTSKMDINLYYHNQMHTNYRLDERILRNTIINNTIPKENHKVNLIIFYRNKRTSNLIMKNNLSPPIPPLKQSRLVYEFTCPLHQNNDVKYIGYTENTLLHRLNQHTYDGSIHKHFSARKPTRKQLGDNTKPIAIGDNKFKLLIKEALLIQKLIHP